jgi:23S rRNA pseudouridine1911/1915/1917 synthase
MQEIDEDLILVDSQESDELYEHHRIVAEKGVVSVRIDKFLMDRLPRVSRNRVQNAIRSGSIKVNEKEVKPNYKIRPLEVVTVVLPHPPSDGKIVAEDIPLTIVYEDDDLMVINKQPGLVVHPGLGNYEGTLVNALAWYFKDKNLPNKAGNLSDRPGLVHRIDKDTSGLMLIAKSDYAMTHLAKQFFDHTIERTYNALVWGQPNELAGTIESNIGRNPRDRMQFCVLPEGEEGKHAITHYKTLEPMYYVSLVECKLETGRTHQIRVHMKSMGHPLFQDARYGGHEIVKGTVYTKYKQFVLNAFKIMTRQALHAKTLGFTHPTTGERMQFDSELPDDFANVLTKWRDYLNHRKELLE